MEDIVHLTEEYLSEACNFIFFCNQNGQNNILVRDTKNPNCCTVLPCILYDKRYIFHNQTVERQPIAFYVALKKFKYHFLPFGNSFTVYTVK